MSTWHLGIIPRSEQPRLDPPEVLIPVPVALFLVAVVFSLMAVFFDERYDDPDGRGYGRIPYSNGYDYAGTDRL